MSARLSVCLTLAGSSLALEFPKIVNLVLIGDFFFKKGVLITNSAPLKGMVHIGTQCISITPDELWCFPNYRRISCLKVIMLAMLIGEGSWLLKNN